MANSRSCPGWDIVPATDNKLRCVLHGTEHHPAGNLDWAQITPGALAMPLDAYTIKTHCSIIHPLLLIGVGAYHAGMIVQVPRHTHTDIDTDTHTVTHTLYTVSHSHKLTHRERHRHVHRHIRSWKRWTQP